MALGLYWATVALVLFLTILALDIMGIFSRKSHFDVDGRVSLRSPRNAQCYSQYTKTVLLTGGSQGMGRGLGKLLAQRGANVVIVARTESKLIEALEYISVR